MPTGTTGLALTLALATTSGTVFLLLRCQGVGRPFGRSSRWWALAVIGLTGAASTIVAIISVALMRQIPPALVGVIAPSGLWLGYVRRRGEGRRSLGQEISTLWLASLLERLHQAMAEDRLTWCEARVDEMWSDHELSLAANYYYENIRERLSPEEHRREKVHSRLQAIERRLDVAYLISDGAARSKVMTALSISRVTKDARYERYLNDLPRLDGILRHDAERDLIRLLSSAYRCGYYRLEPFTPPTREPYLEDPLATPMRPHP